MRNLDFTLQRYYANLHFCTTDNFSLLRVLRQL